MGLLGGGVVCGGSGRGGGAFDVSSGEEGLIGVDGGDGAARGEWADFAGFAGGGVSPIQRAIAAVKDAGRFAAGVDEADAAFDDGAGFALFEVEDGDAFGGGVDEALAVGGVAVLIEIEAGGAGFVG